MRDGGQRHFGAVRRGNEQPLQDGWVLAELRRHFEHDFVLVGCAIDGRDLALAERVVKRLVDQRRGQTELLGLLAIDDHVDMRRGDLLVGGDLLQLR